MFNPALIAPLMGVLDKVFDRVWPDPEKKAQAQLELIRLQQEGAFKELDASLQLALGQIDVNKVEAGSDSLFKSGWRPFVGWTCGGGLFYQVIASPIFGWVAANLWQWGAPPSLDMETLLTLLFGLLGLGAYRTYEKTKK